MRPLALLKLKSELKLAAHLIRAKRPIYRQAQAEFSRDSSSTPKCKIMYELGNQIGSLQYEFRTRHIAYCMIRGKTLEQIESKGKRCNKERCTCYRCPDLKRVKEIVVEYMKYLAQEEVPHEALRTSAG